MCWSSLNAVAEVAQDGDVQKVIQHCQSSMKQHPSVPVWTNHDETWHGNVNKLPRIASVHPVSAFEKGLTAGEKMYVILSQPKRNIKRERDDDNDDDCSSVVVGFAQNLMRSLIPKYKDVVMDASAFSQEDMKDLYSYLTVYGKYEGQMTSSSSSSGNSGANGKYYQIIRMADNLVVPVPGELISQSRASLKSDDADVIESRNFYWFAFTPPLPAKYKLGLNIDFTHCNSSLENPLLGSQKYKEFEAPVPDRHINREVVNISNKTRRTRQLSPTVESQVRRRLLPIDVRPRRPMNKGGDFKRTSPVRGRQISGPGAGPGAGAGGPPKNAKKKEETSPYTWGDSYCTTLLAERVISFEINVHESNSASTSKETTATKAATRNNYFKSMKCDLSDMTHSYWVYPPVAINTPVKKLLQFGVPHVNNIQCPSLYTRISMLRDPPKSSPLAQNNEKPVIPGKRMAMKTSRNLCLAGDSNSRRICMSLKNGRDERQMSTNFYHNGIHGLAHCPDFDHVRVGLTSRKNNSNIEGFVGRLRQCHGSNPATLTAICMGHHVIDYNANELKEILLLPLKKQIDAIHKQKVNPIDANPIIVWGTFASHVNRFRQKEKQTSFPRSLFLKSNAYRESLQNLKLKQVFSGNNNEDINQFYTYVDTYHVSLALGNLVHNEGDPVHFHSDYFYLNSLMSNLFLVAKQCFKNKNAQDGSCKDYDSPNVQNVLFEYIKWRPVEQLYQIEMSTPKFPANIDYDDIVKNDIPA